MNNLVRFEDCIAYVDNTQNLNVVWREITNNPICKDSNFLVVYHVGDNYETTTLEHFANFCDKKEEYQYLMINNYTYDIQVPTIYPFNFQMIEEAIIIEFNHADDEEKFYALDILMCCLRADQDDPFDFNKKHISIYTYSGIQHEYSIIEFARKYNLLYVLKNFLIKNVLDIQ